MLKNMHHEEWGGLKTLTGNAEHLPEAIHGLLSQDKTVAESAYWKIDNHAVVQGDLFSAAAVLPKYLYEVVLKSKHKQYPIDLIWQIGTGYCEDAILQKQCFSEAVKAYELLLSHPDIISTEIHEIVRNELNDLLQIEASRNNST